MVHTDKIYYKSKHKENVVPHQSQGHSLRGPSDSLTLITVYEGTLLPAPWAAFPPLPHFYLRDTNVSRSPLQVGEPSSQDSSADSCFRAPKQTMKHLVAD